MYFLNIKVKYFLFNLPEIETEELILLLYVNNNHYDLISPKRNNQKNKKLYNNLIELDKSCTYKINNNNKINILKYNEEYVHVKYPASDNIYNEIFNYLSSIEIYKDDI